MNKLACVFFSALMLTGAVGAQTISAASNNAASKKSLSPPELSHTILGGHAFTLEVARTPEQLQKGLSKRNSNSLPDNHGMLFVFEHAQPLQFWMKDTYIPLDLIYFNSNGSFNAVYKSIPSCRLPKYTSAFCPTYPSRGNARYVVELKGGTLDRLNITPSTLTLPKTSRL